MTAKSAAAEALRAATAGTRLKTSKPPKPTNPPDDEPGPQDWARFAKATANAVLRDTVRPNPDL